MKAKYLCSYLLYNELTYVYIQQENRCDNVKSTAQRTDKLTDKDDLERWYFLLYHFSCDTRNSISSTLPQIAKRIEAKTRLPLLQLPAAPILLRFHCCEFRDYTHEPAILHVTTGTKCLLLF